MLANRVGKLVIWAQLKKMNVILQEPEIVESIFVNHYAKYKSYHKEGQKGG